MGNTAGQAVSHYARRRRHHGESVSRRAKGPRLYFRTASPNRPGFWIILDGTIQRGTGLGIGATEQQKEEALKAYLTSKHTAVVTTVSRDPTFILVTDVLLKYAIDVAPKTARPGETKSRLARLGAETRGMRLSDINGDWCRQYARRRGGGARRELEDLRAAINYHRREGLHDRLVGVVLPPKPEGRERYLMRSEAARLIWAAWRHRDENPFKRRSRRHVAKFMVVARYMGSRAGVICAASIEDKRPPGKPWIDLETGLFYGRGTGERATKKRRQTVRVPEPLLAHLRRSRRLGQRFAVEFRGKPVSRVSKGHREAVKAAGLGSDVTPHIWRHTVATWLMQAGADPWKVAAFLAMSYETLIRVYGHHHPDHAADVHAALQRQRFVKETREQHGNSTSVSEPKVPVKSRFGI